MRKNLRSHAFSILSILTTGLMITGCQPEKPRVNQTGTVDEQVKNEIEGLGTGK
jgi:hypothetical protein